MVVDETCAGTVIETWNSRRRAAEALKRGVKTCCGDVDSSRNRHARLQKDASSSSVVQMQEMYKSKRGIMIFAMRGTRKGLGRTKQECE